MSGLCEEGEAWKYRHDVLFEDYTTERRRRAEVEERVEQLEAEVRLLTELLKDVQEGNVPPGQALLINTKWLRRYGPDD